MARATVSHPSTEAEPRVRRGYFECRYGQLHVHNAIPPGGGFEEGTPLLCLHQNPGSGRVFGRFLILAGRDRSVYAPDTPGFGESDPPGPRPAIADYAGAFADFLDSMRFRQIDVLGHQVGALMAAELAITRPNLIRRLVMVSVPLLTEAERELVRRAPALPGEDGNQLLAEWRRTLDALGPGIAQEVRLRMFADRLASGAHSAWSLAAAHQYAARERLPLVTQPTLVLRPRDEYWDATARVREVLPKARCMDLPDQGAGLFEVAPEVVVGATRDFLRG
ncbi:MAG TPA: alpha/beta fold hydrolase [Steroidobacteraceae bacterium]|nr:alpha/beta fold hydrolase [Steroidobacteraceae bacterium]